MPPQLAHRHILVTATACDTLLTLILALRSRTEPHYSWPSLPSSSDIPTENAHRGFQRPGQKESPHHQFQDHISKTHTYPPMLFLEAWVHDAAGVTQSVTGIWERRETLRGTWRMTTSGWTITLLLLSLSSLGECKHTQTHTQVQLESKMPHHSWDEPQAHF